MKNRIITRLLSTIIIGIVPVAVSAQDAVSPTGLRVFQSGMEKLLVPIDKDDGPVVAQRLTLSSGPFSIELQAMECPPAQDGVYVRLSSRDAFDLLTSFTNTVVASAEDTSFIESIFPSGHGYAAYDGTTHEFWMSGGWIGGLDDGFNFLIGNRFAKQDDTHVTIEVISVVDSDGDLVDPGTPLVMALGRYNCASAGDGALFDLILMEFDNI